MNESDIKEIINILETAIKSEDWDAVSEAKDYLQEFVESDEEEEF